MKKHRLTKEKDSFGVIILGIIFLFIALVLVYLFRETFFKNQKYKTDLLNKIQLKEQRIFDLIAELEGMKMLEKTFRNKAVRFYRTLKIVVIILFIGIGFVCFGVFGFGALAAIGVVASVISGATLLYQVITIVWQNKVGDFNRTLYIIEQSIIERTYRKNSFEPTLITVIEEQLNNEKQELELLRLEYAGIE